MQYVHNYIHSYLLLRSICWHKYRDKKPSMYAVFIFKKSPSYSALICVDEAHLCVQMEKDIISIDRLMARCKDATSCHEKSFDSLSSCMVSESVRLYGSQWLTVHVWSSNSCSPCLLKCIIKGIFETQSCVDYICFWQTFILNISHALFQQYDFWQPTHKCFMVIFRQLSSIRFWEWLYALAHHKKSSLSWRNCIDLFFFF